MTKLYDQSYFDRWYRSSKRAVRDDVTRRKARLALAAAEHLLGRDVRTVLDIGCGEAPWRGMLRQMRRGLVYTGVDPSDYVVQRYGRSRNIIQGNLAALATLPLLPEYDLVVCSDVLQYLPNDDVRAGLVAIAERLGGVAFVEAFTAADDMVGDHQDWHMRSARWYRRAFADAELHAVGLHLYVGEGMLGLTNELECC